MAEMVINRCLALMEMFAHYGVSLHVRGDEIHALGLGDRPELEESVRVFSEPLADIYAARQAGRAVQMSKWLSRKVAEEMDQFERRG